MTTNEADPQQPSQEKVVLLPGAYKCTDLGNAERLVARFRGQIRYCPPRKRWLTWDDRRWRWDETGEINRKAKTTVRGIYGEAEACRDGEIRKAISKHARDSESGKSVAAMIKFAQSEADVPVLPSELDADPWKLCVLNGTIDLQTGKLHPHRRFDLITRLAPVTYHPAASSEVWDRFLADATGGDAELAGYLQRAVGYALQGTCSERAFFFLIGQPGTAKSTFIDAISAALGDYHQAASFETWLQQTNVGGNRGDLVRLASVRLVTSVEVRRGAKFDEQILKSVTGGDLITAAAKYEGEITFRPAFALWLAANNAPTIRDDDEGCWSRVRRIPFDHLIPEADQDRTLKVRIQEPEVRAAVLAWAVQGCLDWQREGLGASTAIAKSTAEYRQDMDRIGGFFGECCAFEVDGKMSREALRHAYDGWCKEQGIRFPMTAKEIASRLRDKGCADAKSDGKRIWKGVRLLESWEEPRVTGADGVTIPINFPHERGQEKVWGNADPEVPRDPQRSFFDDEADERKAIQEEGEK